MSSGVEGIRSKRAIAVFAIPTSLEAMTFLLVGALNQFFIGYLGEEKSAAASAANQFLFTCFLALSALSTGAMVMGARHWGAKEREKFGLTVSLSLVLVVVSSVLFCICVIYFARSILVLIGAEGNVLDASEAFLRIIVCSVPFMVASEVLCRHIRSLGDSTTPALIALATLGLNALADYICIFGMLGVSAPGIQGVAWATVACRAVGTVILLFLLFHKAGPVLNLRGVPFAAQFNNLKDQLRISIPVISFDVVRGVSVLMLTALYSRMGDIVLAAGQIIFTIELFFLAVAYGWCSASMVFISYQLGTASRALAATQAKLVLQSMLTATIPVTIVLLLTSEFVTIFYPNFEPETTEMIRSGLLIVAVFYPIKAIGIVLRNGILRSGGDVTYVFRTELLALLPVGLLAYVLGWQLGLGLNGILLGGFVVEAVKCCMYWWRLTSGRWIHISQP